jgi:hypothetical protein
MLKSKVFSMLLAQTLFRSSENCFISLIHRLINEAVSDLMWITE